MLPAISISTVSVTTLALRQGGRRIDFGSLARIREHILADHAERHLLQVGAQLNVELLELGPKHALDEAAWRPQHDGRAPLPRIAIGRDAVAPAQRQEQVPRPGVRHRELKLGRLFMPAKLHETGANALKRSFRCKPLTLGPGARKQRLDLAQLLAQPRI